MLQKSGTDRQTHRRTLGPVAQFGVKDYVTKYEEFLNLKEHQNRTID